MNGWTWRELSNDTPPARTIVMEKSDRGAVYIFTTLDGNNWNAMITRARNEPLTEEPVTWEHMMELKAVAEKPD